MRPESPAKQGLNAAHNECSEPIEERTADIGFGEMGPPQVGFLCSERPGVNGPCDLYRAVDSTGATIDFFLSAVRSADAAKALLSKSSSDRSHPQPRVINTDKARCYPLAISKAKHQGILRRRCRHRPVPYLNNILEQDHRAINKRIGAKLHFRRVDCARRTIQGYETIHEIRKGQVRWLRAGDVRVENEFIDRIFGLTA